MRAIQDEAVRSCHEAKDELVFFCEHPPTLALGPRTRDSDIFLTPAELREKGISVLRAERGGGPSYHGPGQLMLYPVVSLPRHRMGVRRFVTKGLEAVVNVLLELGLDCFASDSPAGVWMQPKSEEHQSIAPKECCQNEKLLSVGLRIQHGVTNHGFCLNVDCELTAFTFFSSCGQRETRMTSIAEESGRESCDWAVLLDDLSRNIEEMWGLRS
jgi:lipoate-protein ligase B